MKEIVIGSRGNSGCGDFCWITAVSRYCDNLKVLLHDDVLTRKNAEIFENVAKVEFVDNPPERPDKDCRLPIHRAQKLLRSIGVNDNYCMPRILLNDNEIEWAKAFLGNYKSIVCMDNNNSGDLDPINHRARYVLPPKQNTQEICDKLVKERFQVLQFGPPEGLYGDRPCFSPLQGAVHIRGLSIRQLLACFSQIHFGIFGDSGTYHMFLGANPNGTCFVSAPEHNVEQWGYDYNDLLYTQECFGKEKMRVKYFKHQDYKSIIDNYL